MSTFKNILPTFIPIESLERSVKQYPLSKLRSYENTHKERVDIEIEKIVW